jgi:predicted nucleic acid-binding protein
MRSRALSNAACVIDSDIAIDYLRLRDYTIRLLDGWAEKGRICISVLTHFEVYQGIRPKEESNTRVFLNGLLSIDVTQDIAKQAAEFSKILSSRGITIGIADAIIAATAIELNVPLITNNVKHFSVPGLTIIHGRKGDSFQVKERRQRYIARK